MDERVVKDKTDVEVHFTDGTSMRGNFFVEPEQRVIDMLNDSRAFIPFQDMSGAIRLINKTLITNVKPLRLG
ncbi:DUF6812 domain-containing protein [Zavarzinia sp. CC-PAN008]|uniref:DUF6812 domain-containing protein n=1 Tax=Zavarzinia sp. CC-PAN008 TaxID=3243332 RepID=UPI003F74A25D